MPETRAHGAARTTAPPPDAEARPGGWVRFGTTVSERQVAALAELGRTMVSGVDYEQVLAAVIEKTARTLDSSSGAFMLYDEATGQLVLQKPAFGVDNEEVIAEYRVPLSGGGNAVTVFVSGQSYLSNDVSNDPRILQRYARLFDAVRTMTVPLQVEGRSIGVFHVINKRSGDYTWQDLELLQLMAPQLAVIIQSAAMMRQLRQHEQQLERIMSVHNALSGMVLVGGDLQALTDHLSQLLGLEVLVVEGSGRTVWSPGLPSRLRAPATAGLQAALVQMEREAVPQLTPVATSIGPGRTDPSALSVPIVVGTELLGALGAIGPRTALDDLAGRTLQQAALIFALELVKEREVYEVERRLQADAVEQILVSESDAEGTQLLRRLGLEPDSCYRAAYLGLVPADPQLALSGRIQTYLGWLHRSATSELAGRRRRAAVVARGQGLLVLLPAAEDENLELESDRLTDVLNRLASQVPARIPIARVMGVGGIARRPSELRRSFDEASMVVAVQSRLGLEGRVIFFEQLGVYRLLAQPSGVRDLEQFVDRALGPLLEHDRRNRTDWTRFVEALVQANFSVKTAARRLGLHVNTAKYRAGRIEVLLGVELSDPDARFDLHMALKIRSLLHANRTPG